MSESIANNRGELLAKIDALFEYRKLPKLIDMGGASPDQKRNLIRLLVNLQVSIYDLDQYLESTWELKDSELDFWWKPIHAAMSALGIPNPKQMEYLAHIKKYQKHERQLRAKLFPTRFEMEYFYFYKSCDVKLLRRIIYKQFPKLKNLFSLADWRAFDLITEIDDDVEDVFEDQSTINGNRFLIGICHNGLDETVSSYLDFMKDVRQKTLDRFNNTTSSDQERLKEWTLTEWRKTEKRIHDIHEKCKVKPVKLMF